MSARSLAGVMVLLGLFAHEADTHPRQFFGLALICLSMCRGRDMVDSDGGMIW